MTPAIAAVALAFTASTTPGVQAPNPMWFGMNTELAVPSNLPARAGYAAALRATGTRAIRYPGGSPASFWEWRTGRFVPTEEIRRVWSDAWFQWEQAPGVAKLAEGTLGASAIARFARDRDMTVQWVLNLTTRPDDQPAMFTALVDEGLAVTHVEMDNETYFWGAEFWGEPGVRKYSARVAAAGAAARAAFPRVRIGVVADPGGIWEAPGADPHRKVWNDILGEPDIRSGYDAWILHHYLDQHRFGEVPLADLPSAFLGWPEASLRRAVTELRRRDPKRSLWVTEYNVNYHALAGANSDTGRWLAATRGTGWHALYLASFILTAGQLDGALEVLTCHSLEAGGGFALVEGATGDDPAALRLSPAARVFSRLSEWGRDATAVIPAMAAARIPSGARPGGEPDPGALQAVAFSSKAGMRIALLNRSRHPVEVNFADGPESGERGLETWTGDAREPATAVLPAIRGRRTLRLPAWSLTLLDRPRPPTKRAR